MGVCWAWMVPSYANAWWTVKIEPTLAFVCSHAVPNHVTATAGREKTGEADVTEPVLGDHVCS